MLKHLKDLSKPGSVEVVPPNLDKFLEFIGFKHGIATKDKSFSIFFM